MRAPTLRGEKREDMEERNRGRDRGGKGKEVKAIADSGWRTGRDKPTNSR
jgi:hypothetical protein